jgi:hypothetical protein
LLISQNQKLQRLLVVWVGEWVSSPNKFWGGPTRRHPR